MNVKQNMLSQDGLRSLLLVATSLDDECQYNVAVIYRKLCADRHTHDYVVGRGGLQALIGLVQLRGLGTQRQAAAALRDVCSNKDHKVTVDGRSACIEDPSCENEIPHAIIVCLRSFDQRFVGSACGGNFRSYDTSTFCRNTGQ